MLLILITGMGGISTFYACSGKFALQGFLTLVTALCTSILLIILPDSPILPGRRIAVILTGAISLISLFSLDMVSTRLLSTPLLSLLSRCNSAYAAIDGVEEYIRINSIYEAPNIFAGCAGIGVLLGLSLALSSTQRRERCIHLTLLYLNALSFVLSFSMGAVVSIAVAFFVYFLLESAERRGELLVLMLETFLLVLLGLVPVSMTALGPWNGIQPLPLLTVCMGAGLLCAAHHFIGKTRSGFLQQNRKRILLCLIAPILCLLVYTLIAYHWTNGCTLPQDSFLRRAVYLDPGHYDVTMHGSGNVSVLIESQNQQDAMMHTSTVVYEGDLQHASFEVGENSLVTYFTLSAETDATLEQVVCTDTYSSRNYMVPLDYPLLPDFIANRLQGLFANENVLQRLVFFQDGLKLFRQSPLLGLGLGAFESTLFQVQTFYYETKYVHNHYIQTLLETGIVGLVLLLLLLTISAGSVLRTRKQMGSHPFTAGLGASLLFMALHACVEVVFSSGIYLPLAFGVFALAGTCSHSVSPQSEKLRAGSVMAVEGLLLCFAVLLGCNLYARHIGHNATSLEDYRQAAQMDPFEWTDYAVSYVANAPAFDSPTVKTQAEEYILRLDQETSNTLHYYLAQYYFQTGQMEQAFEMAEKQARHTISSSTWWNTLFAMMYAYDDGSQLYQNGIQSLVDLMHTWDSENMGDILLEENVQRFVDQVLCR
ncbi:MAG: O-antigen ligase family protein [Lachnospiraceae bacterium]|nr:O-antigen ligase family protein [Lachnospiraceae bacterium]